MPHLIDYPTVLSTLAAQGLHPLYHHSGTFGFPDDPAVQYTGWIGPDDPTLRPAARDLAQRVPEPFPQTLARLATQFWLDHAPTSPAWFTPGSHWAYELQDGGEHYMPNLLRAHHIDPAPLRDLNTGAALEFSPAESPAFQTFLTAVLHHTRYTDYGLLFPTLPLAGLLHHHTQIWWRVKELRLLQALRALPATGL